MANRLSKTVHNGPNVALVWFALLLGAVVYVPISLPPFNFIVQIAAFDFIIIALIIWGLWRGWLDLPPQPVVLIVLGITTAITVHTSLIYFLSTDVNVEWLVKESVKLVVVAVQFGCLLTLFRCCKLWSPPKYVVAPVLVGAIILIVLLSYLEPIYVTRTIYMVTLAGLILILSEDGTWHNSPKERLWLMLACLAVVVTAILVHNKAVAGMMLTMAAWIALRNYLSKLKNARITITLTALVLVFLGGLVLSAFVGANIDLLRNMDTLERSIHIRSTLWNLAIKRFFATFPVGIGLGQFSEATKTVPLLAIEGHKFTHNSLLGLATSMGFLGVFFAVGLSAIILFAAAGWLSPIVPLYFIVVLPPLLIHDGHTIRILLIITALGLARYMYRSKEDELSSKQ